jgi:SAM-dependent methyltransferase
VSQSNDAEARLYNHTDQLIKGHETLLRDARRNQAFYQALAATVSQESQVLDIGSGAGIWAIAAARLGAKRVVAIEQEPLLINVIRDFAMESGVGEKVTVIQGDSQQIDLDREFDVIISETLGHLIFDEPLLPVMIDARERFLRPGGILIPEGVSLIAAGAQLKEAGDFPAGIPLAHHRLASLAMHIPVGLRDPSDRARLTILTDARELVRLDLRSVSAAPDLNTLTALWESADVSQINCFAVWAEIQVTQDIRLKTMDTTSWMPMIYRIEPFHDDQGTLKFVLTLTSKSNYWTASLTAGDLHEEQSYSPAQAATELVAGAVGGGEGLTHLRDLTGQSLLGRTLGP